MTDATSSQSTTRPQIEGGVDAIVLGGSCDGIAAAALLARAGLKTVLLDQSTELGLPLSTRSVGEATVCDGEHLVSALDPALIETLDLYRHGLVFAARRLETTYFFDDGEALQLGGDPANAAFALDPPEPGLDDLLADALRAGRTLNAIFDKGARKVRAAPDERDAAALEDMLLEGAVCGLRRTLDDGPAFRAMLAETVFRSAAAPDDPFSLSGIVRRFAGEASGLQGAVGYPAGGPMSVIDALRRSAQSARVDIRAGVEIDRILIEQDRVAGVGLADGGQIRCPIVISALDAQTTFVRLIGAAMLNPAFHRMLAMRRERLASCHLHLLLSEPPGNNRTREHLARRLVFAPDLDALRGAFADARRGKAPKSLILELIAPAALEKGSTPSAEQSYLSIIAHPLPLLVEADENIRDAIADRIIEMVEKLAPGVSEMVAERMLVLPIDQAEKSRMTIDAFAAPGGLLRQRAFADQCAAADQIGGLYFCGPEAQYSAGLSGAAGRRAAQAALGKLARPGAAP